MAFCCCKKKESSTNVLRRSTANRVCQNTGGRWNTTGPQDPQKQLVDKLKELKLLLKEQDCLENQTLTNAQMVQYLQSNDNNVQRAAVAACRHYHFKTAAPHLFANRDPHNEQVQNAWNLLNIFTIPEKTDEGRTILYVGLKNKNPKQFNIHDAVKLFSIAVEGAAAMDPVPTSYIVIVDAEGWTMDFAPPNRMPTVKVFVKYMKEAMPIKLYQAHVINPTNDARKMYSIMEALNQRSLNNRVIMHCKDKKTLEKFVPLELLPSEIGGSNKTIAIHQKNFKDKIEDMAVWFQQDDTKGANRSIRGSYRDDSIDDLAQHFRPSVKLKYRRRPTV